MWFKGDKELCAYETNELKDWLYVFCIFLRMMIGFLFIYKTQLLLSYQELILFLFTLTLLSFIYKFYICAFITWKNYLRFILIYSIILLILISTRYNKNNIENQYKLIGMLVIIDALFGMTSKFNFKRFVMK